MFGIFRQNIDVDIIGGGYVNGKWVEQVTSSITINGSIQPTKGKELQTLAEGRRVSEAYTVYTQDAVDLDASANQAVLFGNKFEIVKLNKWTNNIINHTEIVFMRFYDAN